MKMDHTLGGTGVALITPFKNGFIDFTRLEAVIEYVIAGGVDYVVCLGTTGEAVTLTMEECLEVKQFTVRIVNDRVPIVFGLFGGSFTARITERMKEYNLDGITALLSSSPNYIKPTQEGIIRHYEALAAASPLPIIMYNVPGRTASNMEAETVIKLANQKSKIIGIKEASGDMYQGARIAAEVPDDFLVLSGDDLTTLPLIASGGHGVISVIANAFPKAFSMMTNAALEGNFVKARSFNQPLLKMYKWIFVEGSPGGIKFVLSHMNLCTPELRLPLMELSKSAQNAMMADLEEAIAFEKSLV